jgi:hypothetical protein
MRSLGRLLPKCEPLARSAGILLDDDPGNGPMRHVGKRVAVHQQRILGDDLEVIAGGEINRAHDVANVIGVGVVELDISEALPPVLLSPAAYAPWAFATSPSRPARPGRTVLRND